LLEKDWIIRALQYVAKWSTHLFLIEVKVDQELKGLNIVIVSRGLDESHLDRRDQAKPGLTMCNE